jgi:phosphoribosylaminoimidazole-succinocarboxamide synthase
VAGAATAIPPCVPRTDLEGLALIRRGKVRDVYALDERRLLLVASDRVSAFDWVLDPAIPYKGAVLTAISAWWFRALAAEAPAHFLTDDVDAMPEAARRHAALIRGRATLCRRARIVPFECVVRGRLAGSAVAEYERTGKVYGEEVGPGLAPGAAFAEPLFTPTTKALAGHDEPVPLARIEAEVGAERARELKERSVALFRAAAARALERGLVLVDTKLEWGIDEAGALLVCDEAFTPDSSRYWRAEEVAAAAGRALPAPLDKQVVRDWLLRESGWDVRSAAAPPPLPPGTVIETARRYLALHEALTGRPLGAERRP